jgi:hypothetical protein
MFSFLIKFAPCENHSKEQATAFANIHSSLLKAVQVSKVPYS